MGYLEEARARAKRRKSRWNLLLVPVVIAAWALLWYASAQALGQLVRRARPELTFVLLPNTGSGILIAIGLLFAWLPIAMVIANLLVAAIPPARRILDHEAHGIPGADLISSERWLLKLAAFMTPAGLLVALIGVVVS